MIVEGKQVKVWVFPKMQVEIAAVNDSLPGVKMIIRTSVWQKKSICLIGLKTYRNVTWRVFVATYIGLLHRSGDPLNVTD